VVGGARRVGAGGLALVEKVVAIPADIGRLPAGLPQAAAGVAAAAGGAPRSGQEQAQRGHADRPDHHAVQEQPALGAGHVVAER
jgi:hypothetical protein